MRIHHMTIDRSRLTRVVRNTLLCLVAMQLVACAGQPFAQAANPRRFAFERDTFAFHNELTWEYRTDPVAGTTTMVKASADAKYTLHCFVLARSARQFFQFARFAPEQPVADETTYRKLIRAVIAHDPSEHSSPRQRIEIPGYADLRSFSVAREQLLKEELGTVVDTGAWCCRFPAAARARPPSSC
jgi:hypothetical protein